VEGTVRLEKIKLKGSPVGAENPQPFFRQPDLDVAAGTNYPENKKYSFGRETGFRILPYKKQDRYDRRLVDMEFSLVVMENEFLRAEFIPALGGRLWSLFDKRRNRDILYTNPIFRPANLAIRDAWFSGGIEWNIGRLGHTVHTCDPVFAGIFEADGNSILRLWEFERQTRLFWRIEFILPEDSAVLFTYTRIENPDKVDKPLYWWTNAAILQTPGVRVFSNCDEVIYVVPGLGKTKTMDYGTLPHLPVLSDKDASYPINSDYSNEYFFQNDKIDCGLPFEAAVYEDGYTYGEMSTHPLVYRKMFCWGTDRGGQRWQEFLSMPGQGYLEVQAGLAPTQLHTTDINAGQTIDWVQAFTAFQADAQLSHQKDYPAARAYITDNITKYIDSAEIQAALEQGRKRSGKKAKIINMGSGWGALEGRLTGILPAGLLFPYESIGKAEAQWAELLRTGFLPKRSAQEEPGSFVIDQTWEKLLKKNRTRDKNWLTPYHLGVIYFEQGNIEKAETCWKESVKRNKNAWAFRNLALSANKKGDIQTALDYYRRIMKLNNVQEQSFVEEFIPLLLINGKVNEASVELNIYIERVGSMENLSAPLLEAAARIALSQGNNSMLDRIFSIEQAHVREGYNIMVEIWTEWKIMSLCNTGITREKAEEQVQNSLAAGSLLPPKEIDFRMYKSTTSSANNHK